MITVQGHHICPEFIKPIPYEHPTFIEVYEWTKGKYPSKIVGDMHHEKTCVLACMMNELHPGYTHSLRDGELAVYRFGYFQGSFLVKVWLSFLLYPELEDMTAAQFLQKLLDPWNVQIAKTTEAIPEF